MMIDHKKQEINSDEVDDFCNLIFWFQNEKIKNDFLEIFKNLKNYQDYSYFFNSLFTYKFYRLFIEAYRFFPDHHTLQILKEIQNQNSYFKNMGNNKSLYRGKLAPFVIHKWGSGYNSP